MINLVTAVSRPINLKRVYQSILQSLKRSSLKAKWILVVDGPNVIPAGVWETLQKGPVQVELLIHSGGKCSYGIAQKNLGMASIVTGFFHCLDDDNIVHPDFFSGLERAMRAAPGKRAYAFGQKRWDNVKSLTAAPDRMEYGKIDNTMFVVHQSLIGDKRYDLTRSGREDFHFFRGLYDLYPDEFVFISETLAYYNFIKYFPAETADEKRVIPDRPAKLLVPITPELSPALRAVGVLKIALYSSKRERCGISTYTDQLADSLSLLGHDVRYFGSQAPYEKTFEEILSWGPDIFHVQHETSIMPPPPVFERYLNLIAQAGARVFFTLHTESLEAAQLAGRVLGGRKSVVMHRPSEAAKAAVVIPMPCTNVGTVGDKAGLRRKFDFPDDAFVISTVGFMIPWKDHPKIAESLVPWMLENPQIHLQIIASEHFNESLKGYAQECREALGRVAARFSEGRVRHIDGYPSDRELIERLIASDLGYVWCPFDTASSSAAAAQFISARCPLVASGSTHYDLLGPGVVRSLKGDVSDFLKVIRSTAGGAELLATMRSSQWSTYRERNYLMTAVKHLELYCGEGR